MKQALLVKEIVKTPIKHQAIYKLLDTNQYVLVSGVDHEKYGLAIGPETYIFKWDERSYCWTEQDGSFRGEINHAKALANAGYSAEEPLIIQDRFQHIGYKK